MHVMHTQKLANAILIALLLSHCLPLSSGSPTNSSAVDLRVSDVSISYPNSVNESLYEKFSSNHPIQGFDRPASMYVTDGVVGVEMEINVSVENLGNSDSGILNMSFLILHNEYTRFELLNETINSPIIPAGSSDNVLIMWTPDYSGNHTLVISTSNTLGDIDGSNNFLSRHLTVARIYDNCDNISQWSVSGEWNTSSDAYLSQFSAFHLGNGQFSTYSSLQTSTLTSPALDLSDHTAIHNTAIGYSFFYTGSIGQGDEMKGYMKNENGIWDETFTMQGTVDNDVVNEITWRTFSVSYNGRNSPVIPVDNKYFHSSTQLRFIFTSDSVEEDIGIWIDELVIIYEQAAKKQEFAVDLSGGSILGGLAGEWSTTRLEVTNTGNVSERYMPTANGIPPEWSHYFSYTNGVSVSSTGIDLLPGQTKEFDLKVKTNDSSNQGNYPVEIRIESNTHQIINASVNSTIKILPSRIPVIIQPEISPRCLPGHSCEFNVTLENAGEATDVFTLELEDKVMPNGWSINFAWDQSSAIQVRPNQPNTVKFVATIPAGIEPDIIAETWLTATSQNDTTKYDRKAISIAAAMVSDAEISMNYVNDETIPIKPGSSIELEFIIFNNASRIDIFRPSVDYTELTGWSVELSATPDLAINPGQSSRFTIEIFAPENAQANDIGPKITPQALSLRSGELITGLTSEGVIVESSHDLAISLIESPSTLRPGSPALISLKVTNNGNGGDIGIISLPQSPESWKWWAFVDDENVTNGLPLSVSYDLDNVKIVDLWLYLPPLESPNEFHEIVIQITPNNGIDENLDDNTVSFEGLTKTIRSPRLDSINTDLVVSTNSSHSFDATAWNIGNAADSTIRARLVIESSPISEEITGFLSTEDGISKPAGEWINLNLGPTESKQINAQIIISTNCSLNTVVSVIIQLEGGIGEDNLPLLESSTSVLMVTERRNVVIEKIPESISQLPTGAKQTQWVNITSTSTQPEILDVSSTMPKGWGMLCLGTAINNNPFRIELSQGHITEQKYNMRCELIREKGDLEGRIEIYINSSDGVIKERISQDVVWESEDEVSGISLLTISSISGIIVIFALSVFFIRRYFGIDDDLSNEEADIDAEEMVSGPPATVLSGPPASSAQQVQQFSAMTSQVVDTPSSDAVEEYHRQMVEYNRKVAEYEAWEKNQN